MPHPTLLLSAASLLLRGKKKFGSAVFSASKNKKRPRGHARFRHVQLFHKKKKEGGGFLHAQGREGEGGSCEF